MNETLQESGFKMHNGKYISKMKKHIKFPDIKQAQRKEQEAIKQFTHKIYIKNKNIF